MNQRLGILLVCILATTAVGCAKHVHVQTSLVAEDQLLPRLNMGTPVSVTTIPHPQTEKVNFCKAGLGPMTLLYADLTEYARRSIIDIFNRNDIQIKDQATKQVTVAIIEAACVQEFNGINYSVEIEVRAGDLPAKQFSGYQRLWSAHALSFTVTAATLNAVLEMFKDEEIKNYLENG